MFLALMNLVVYLGYGMFCIRDKAGLFSFKQTGFWVKKDMS